MSTFTEARRAAMSRAASKRKRHGNRPDRDVRDRTATLVGSTERDGVTWELYDFKPKSENTSHIDYGGEWSSHKLVALPGRPGKANFWFGYNYQEARTTKSAEVVALMENEPAIYAWVLATLDPDSYGGLA